MKVLILSRVDLIDVKKVKEIINSLKEIEECLVCLFIDEKEIAYAEKKIVNTGWVGEKIGNELMASISRAFRQEAYAQAEELEKTLKSENITLRILIEMGNESEILEKLVMRERPDKTYIFKEKSPWWMRIIRKRERKNYPANIEIITVR